LRKEGGSTRDSPSKTKQGKTVKVIIIITAIAVFAIAKALAGTTDYKAFKEKVVIDTEECNFRDMEFQIDAFAVGVAAARSHGQTLNSGFGGGGGLNFFFARYFGIGAEAFWYGNGGTAEHVIVGNAFFRYPICSLNLAPYVMAGGGAGWDRITVGFGHVGGGLEWRFLPNFGLFADGRWFYGAPDNVAVIRSGMRVAF
jgi:hypothetical protein